MRSGPVAGMVWVERSERQQFGLVRLGEKSAWNRRRTPAFPTNGIRWLRRAGL